MIVYRIQNDRNQGPYAVGYFDDDNGGLSPKEDNIREVPYNYLFGFKSMDEFYEFFSYREQEKLSEFGFKVYVYEVDPAFVIQGGTQLCFHENKGVLIESAKIWCI